MTQALTRAEVERLVATALDAGVTLFDTADIYGQGDSERWLGRALKGRPEAFVCTKAGQRLPANAMALGLVKAVLGPVVRAAAPLRSRVLAARSKPLDLCFEPAYLQDAVQASLRRLGRERIDAFFLHNPDCQTVVQGVALHALARLQQSGELGLIGVSTDEEDTAMAALRDPHVGLLQAPRKLLDRTPELGIAASAAGVRILVREVFGGFSPGGVKIAPGGAGQMVRDALLSPGVSAAIVGATQRKHLVEIADAVVASPPV